MRCLCFMTNKPASDSNFEKIKREIIQHTVIEGRESGVYDNSLTGHTDVISMSNRVNNSISNGFGDNS